MSTTEAIVDQLAKLTPQQQERVLDYARSLTSPLPRGAKLSDLLKFAGTIPAEDLKQMQDAIEEGCEQVNSNGW